jgi:phosphate-selective porin OprO/OprP
MKHSIVSASVGSLLIAGLAHADLTTESLLLPIDGTQEAKQEPPKDGADIRVFWKDGFRMETADKAFTMRISGRVQTDAAFFSADEDEFATEWNDGVELRRIYLGFTGKLFKDWDYQIEIDFAKSANEVQDTYLATSTPIGNLKIGHFKQPFSLEELNSDLHTTFMERSLSSAFKIGRDVGVQLSDVAADEKVTWAVGIFKDTDGNGKSSTSTSDDEYAFTGRVTFVPWTNAEGKLVHLGVSASQRNLSGNTNSFSAKPESNLAPTLLTSGTIGSPTDKGDDYQLYGFEAATVLGPLSFQGEYFLAQTDGPSDGDDDPSLSGYYVYASYFLTGEQRNYKKSSGTFDRVKPKENFSFKEMSGKGAMELGLRYTMMDFDEASSTDEASMDDITLGLNWYVNPQARIMFNVIQTNLQDDGIDEDATIYQMRFQFDF